MLVAPPAAFADDPAPAPADSPSAVPVPLPATPQAVQNLRWQELSATTVRLSWDAPSDAAVGVLYSAVARVGGTGQVLTVRTAETSAVFTGVRPGSVVVPEVVTDARRAAGFTDVGPAWMQPPVPASVPRTVRLALVLPGGVPGLRVSWAPPASDGGAPVTGYRIRVSRSGAQVSSAERTVAGGVRSVTFSDVDPGTAYLSTVVAVTQAGDGAVAGTNLVDTDTDTDTAPGPVAIDGDGSGDAGAVPAGAVPVGTVASAPAEGRSDASPPGSGGSGGTGTQVAAPRMQAVIGPVVLGAAALPVLTLLGSVFGILLAGAFAILLVVRRFGI